MATVSSVSPHSVLLSILMIFISGRTLLKGQEEIEKARRDYHKSSRAHTRGRLIGFEVEYFNALSSVGVGPRVDAEEVGKDAHNLGELVMISFPRNVRLL